MLEVSLAAGVLQVDDVIAVVGSICVFLASLALMLGLLVVLKNRGSRPEPALEGPALPPIGEAFDSRAAGPEISTSTDPLSGSTVPERQNGGNRDQASTDFIHEED